MIFTLNQPKQLNQVISLYALRVRIVILQQFSDLSQTNALLRLFESFETAPLMQRYNFKPNIRIFLKQLAPEPCMFLQKYLNCNSITIFFILQFHQCNLLRLLFLQNHGFLVWRIWSLLQNCFWTGLSVLKSSHAKFNPSLLYLSSQWIFAFILWLNPNLRVFAPLFLLIQLQFLESL